jgi:hypothetical protein
VRVSLEKEGVSFFVEFPRESLPSSLSSSSWSSFRRRAGFEPCPGRVSLFCWIASTLRIVGSFLRQVSVFRRRFPSPNCGVLPTGGLESILALNRGRSLCVGAYLSWLWLRPELGKPWFDDRGSAVLCCCGDNLGEYCDCNDALVLSAGDNWGACGCGGRTDPNRACSCWRALSAWLSGLAGGPSSV